MGTLKKVAATSNLVFELALAGVKIALVGVAIVVVYKIVSSDPAPKTVSSTPASNTHDMAYERATSARHQCINMVSGKRKLGSGTMIGRPPKNYMYINKHKILGEQRVTCMIDNNVLTGIFVDGVKVY